MREKNMPAAENQAQAKAQDKGEIQFSPIQQKVIDARGRSLLVSASAGSGKTAVLVERLCRLVMEDHVSIDSVLAVTFTEDAAQEMKDRLKSRLKEAGSSDPWTLSQLSLLETASISTIHGFCLDLVQQYYYLLGISYSMASTIETGIADGQALEEAYQQALLSLDPAKGAALQLYMRAFSRTEEDLQKLILKFVEIASSKPDPEAWMESCRKPGTLFSHWFFVWFELRIQAMLEICRTMLEKVSTMEFAKISKQEEAMAVFEKKIQALEQCLYDLSRQDYPAFRTSCLQAIENTGKFTTTINKVSFKETQTDYKKFEEELLKQLFKPQEYAAFEEEMLPLQDALVSLARKTAENFSAIKKEQQFIDFSDMEQFAWKLLQIPSVKQDLRKRYEVILVDEYQDTNDLQEAIIQSFCRDDNLFMVGDVKQSIYGFRQARPEIMKSHMNQPGPLDEVIYMRENYRSSAALIAFNNVFYQRLMNLPGLSRQFSAQDAALPGTEEQSSNTQYPVRFLYTCYQGWRDPEKEGMTDLQARSLFRRNRADLIARDIEEKVRAGQVRYRDIAILSRASTPHEEIKAALEARGIRSISHLKKGFYTNKAVQIVLSALRVIEDRHNDIALTAMLCSPLGGFSTADLLPYAKEREAGVSLYQALRRSPERDRFLQSVWKMREWRKLPIGEIVQKIYNYRNFYTYSTSMQDKTNLDLLLHKAVQAEGKMTLAEFLSSSALEEDLNKTSEAIAFGREEDAVKIGTIHASKGLQYKLVYLLCEDSNRDMDAGNPILADEELGLSLRYLDTRSQLSLTSAAALAADARRFVLDQEEKMRLLYVATTRAREQLVLVDSIKNEEQFSGPLGYYALLRNKGFTSWVFHAFSSHPIPQLVFERQEGLVERPVSKNERNIRFKIEQYAGPRVKISSQTASQAKGILKWKSPSSMLKAEDASSSSGKERGTLFHEMAAALSYPYQKEAVLAFSQKKGFTLREEDLAQFLSLNHNAAYARWMEQTHYFECPYSVREGDTLVHGYIDLAVITENEISILDFKSDAAFDMESLIGRYRRQLETYKQAMQKIYPDRPVHIYLYSFSLQQLEQLN